MKLIIFQIAAAYITINLQKYVTHHDVHHHLNVNSLNITNYRNLQYTGQLTIGNQDVNLIFDTGSSITWVYSKACTHCAQKDAIYKRVNYDCGASSNCQLTDENYQVNYGVGEVIGTKAIDNFIIANQSVSHYSFLIVDKAYELDFLQADGVCGLGINDKIGFVPILEQLFQQKAIQEKVFSIFLNNLPFEINNSSLLMIGGYEPKYLATNPKFVPVVDEHNWKINLNGIILNKKELQMTHKIALVDTGSSQIVLPPQEFSELLESLRQDFNQFCQFQNQQLLCSCPETNFKLFPSLHFYLDGFSVTLHPIDYIDTYVSTCILQIGKSEMDYVLLGDVFIRKYVPIFDMGTKQIGLAEAIKFEKQAKQIQINDSLYIFKVFLGCICIAIFLIWVIRKISGLGSAGHEIIQQ